MAARRPPFDLQADAGFTFGGTPPGDQPIEGTYVGSRQFVTRDGVAGRADLFAQIPDLINDGWVVDLVEAHTERGPAGYLKISYIPKENADVLYPDAFTWSWRQGGRSIGLRLERTPEDQWTAEDKRDLIARFQWEADAKARRKVGDYDPQTATDEQTDEAWVHVREGLNRRHEESYRAFLGFHVDRPLVDYINVYGDWQENPYVRGARRSGVAHENQRQQGIGTAMYETGALWMWSRKMRLHASGIQTGEAQASWASLKRRGLVTRAKGFADKPRHVLDPRKLIADLRERQPG